MRHGVCSYSIFNLTYIEIVIFLNLLFTFKTVFLLFLHIVLAFSRKKYEIRLKGISFQIRHFRIIGLLAFFFKGYNMGIDLDRFRSLEPGYD